MRAAIYARRSTEEHQAASLDVQVEEAKKYIARKGWGLDPAHVYLDDAVSRAEFKKRPGLIHLLNTAADHAFDVVVVRDESRLGGDQFRLPLMMQDLIENGVKILYYFTDEEVRLEGAVEKFLVAARSFASELEREKIAGRTREHLKFKAEKGFVTGGRVYGYDNVRIQDAGGRSHVEYRINEDEATTVRVIFKKAAGGAGIRTIAHYLNERKVPAPRAGKRGTGSWSPTCIWYMLHHERYRGVIPWGRIGSAYKGGTRVTVEHPESEHILVERPELRIVSDELWQTVVSTRDPQRIARGYGKRAGRPSYLLTGIARCAECGGPMHVINGKDGNKVIKVYACMYHRDRGAAVCANTTRRPVTIVDGSVIGWIQTNLLRPPGVEKILRRLRVRIETGQEGAVQETEVDRLSRQLARLQAQIDRLTQALATSDSAPASIVRAIADREAEMARVRQLLAGIHPTPVSATGSPRWADVEETVRARLRDVGDLFAGSVEKARRALQAMLARPLQFAPQLEGGRPTYMISGELSAGFMFSIGSDPNES